jgi:hypothetical protein
MIKLNTVFDLFAYLDSKIKFMIKYSINFMENNMVKENTTLFSLFDLFFKDHMFFIDKDTQNFNKMNIYKMNKKIDLENKYGFEIKFQKLKEIRITDRQGLDKKLVIIEEKLNLLCLKNINV